MIGEFELAVMWHFNDRKVLDWCHVALHLQLYKLQSALREAGVTMYGGQRASRDLSLERAKSDRCVHQTPLRHHSMYHSQV